MLWIFRPGWHPFIFMLAVGTLIASLVAGDFLVALLMAPVVWWTLRGARAG